MTYAAHNSTRAVKNFRLHDVIVASRKKMPYTKYLLTSIVRPLREISTFYSLHCRSVIIAKPQFDISRTDLTLD